MKPPQKVSPRVDIKLIYKGRKTIRGRIGFMVMRFGAWLVSQPIALRHKPARPE